MLQARTQAVAPAIADQKGLAGIGRGVAESLDRQRGTRLDQELLEQRMDIEMPVQAIDELQLREGRTAILGRIEEHRRGTGIGAGKLENVCSWHTRYYRGVEFGSGQRSDIHAKEARHRLTH
ncbi:MAG: hypothetical protein IPF49_05745 [Gammaproteobacteria bacterium]|nr:hypothetical protein [Gammaproteobacteria bacterium]